jgi:uncharacterized protein Yka (UPF0111/DUF47 family)
MKINLMPKDVKFYKLFVPVSENIETASDILLEMLESSGDEIRSQTKAIKRFETIADAQRSSILKEIAATFVTPFDRADIFQLVEHLENSMDFIYETAELILILKLDSNEYPSKVKKQAKIVNKAAIATAKAMKELKNLDLLTPYFEEMKTLENTADKLKSSLMASLFTLEKDPIRILKIKELAEHFEFIINSLYAVSKIIESIALNEL